MPNLCATLRFSTAGLPEPARVRAVRELHVSERAILSGNLDPIEPLEPLPGCPLDVDLTKRTLPGLAVVAGEFCGLRHAICRRGAPANGGDDLFLVANVRGCCTVRQRDRELQVEDGEAFLATRDETTIAVMRPTPAFWVGCRVPREPVALLLGRLSDMPISAVPRDTEALRLFITYASAIAGTLPLATAELQRLAAYHIHDLLAAIVRAARDGRSIAEGRGIAAARLCAIMRDIEAHIGDGDLSVGKIAGRHRITPRYVHKLFENEGLTFSSFVLGQRLSRAHRMLSDPCRADRNISTIAFAVGFGDLSYFNRAFRRHYGVTPSEVKQSSASADTPSIASQRPRSAM
jgi:AraC-like DNA-binding protein